MKLDAFISLLKYLRIFLTMLKENLLIENGDKIGLGKRIIAEVFKRHEVPFGSGSFGPLARSEMKFLQRIKPHLFKVTLTIVAALLIVQYWRHIGEDTRSFEPLFYIDSPRSKMKFADSPENLTVFEGTEDFNVSSSHNTTTGVFFPESKDNFTRSSTEIPLCPPIPPNLSGRIKIITKEESFEDMEKYFNELEPGGMFRPKECKARYVVALVIPYRDRSSHLKIFLSNIHRLLMKQQIDYGIFVVEQNGKDPFNRGKLMNVGFAEASKIKQFDCFIFHDVDLIPEDDRNLYTCPEQPRHMSVAVNKFLYKLPYQEIFGGVCALSKEHFILTNGFSNSFWGWGGEDDDMYSRVRIKGLHVSRYPPTIARYTMLPHNKQLPNPKRYETLQKGKKLYVSDGLKDLDYDRKDIKFYKLYTWILVDLHPPR